jgi:hypothetical protein
MTKPKDAADARKSEALKNFENNLDEIMVVIKRLDIVAVQKRAIRLQKIVQDETAASASINMKRLMKRLTQFAEKFKASVKTYLDFLFPACRWMTVMLVSFMETYLEDGLIEVAQRNPVLVKADNIETNRVFDVDSIDELRAEIRRNWAHDALRPDGPKKWYRVVRNLGASPLDEKVVYAVQHMWDTRNLIVHARCIADAAYAKKYAHLGAKKDQTVNVNLHTFGSWLDPVKAFVEWADVVFLNYSVKPKSRKAA